MNAEEIKKIVDNQKEFFKSGKTLDIKFRINQLKTLYKTIKKYQDEITEALHTDLGKSEYESYMCEIGLSLSELTYMIKNVKKFSKEFRVKTPLSQFPSISYKKPSPYGNVLIMSPWNYPFLLTIDPLVNAIAAGNTVTIKPSAYSPTTSAIVEKIIKEIFPPEYISVVTGGRQENASLLDQKFDLVFFTGSQNVGKEVLLKCSKHLTPAILELGGKSPCIVDESAKIKLAAKRIVFGKFLNCGQTCVAPDYIVCHTSIKDKLIEEIKKQIILQFDNKPLENVNYGKIINKKHYDRLVALINKDKVIIGGNFDEKSLKIEPTVIDNITFEDDIMQDEIFGPLLPILTYDNIDDLINLLADKPKPLALYLFSNNKKTIKKVTEKLSYGGGCINDTIIHLATSEMGFGGVGESGMGSYHGKDGFDAFSHTKSIVNKKTWLDLPMRYQPYKNKFFRKLINLFLK